MTCCVCASVCCEGEEVYVVHGCLHVGGVGSRHKGVCCSSVHMHMHCRGYQEGVTL